MEWITIIKKAINYMEKNLLEGINPQDVADYVGVSCMYLQKGFQILTGYSLAEYMRNRRLYLAAIELKNKEYSILEVALKYGYENQSSFDKAFVRFHKSTPKDVQRNGSIQTFLPLKVKVEVTGGESMKFRIEEKDYIQVVGFQREFNEDTSKKEIPLFWDEMTERYCPNLMKGLKPESEIEQYIYNHRIGELGVCVDEGNKNGCFDYIIAGYDTGNEIPEVMVSYKIEKNTWAIFECTLKTLQKVTSQIWGQWIVENEEYELAGRYNIEWYSPDSPMGPDQKCEIWLPVIRK